MHYVATAFYLDETRYPGVRSEGMARATVYWRCMATLFASYARWNPNSNTSFAIYSNVRPPDDVAPLINSLDITIHAPEFRARPPVGYHDTYGGSFYSVDALAHLSADVLGPEDAVVILDPDCLCIGSADRAFDKLEGDGTLNYAGVYEAHERVHGMDEAERAELYSTLAQRPIPGSPVFGGELLGFSSRRAREYVPLLSTAWQHSLDRHSKGRTRFPTEEFLFSYVFLSQKAPSGNGNDLIRRVWTSPILYNATPDDFQLVFWHLPAEKTRGFKRLWRSVARSDSWFWTADRHDWLSRVARTVGVTRTPARFAYDAAYRSARAAVRPLRRGSPAR